MWIGIVIAIIVIIAILIIGMYNSFVKLDNKVNEAFSTMDIYLVKRWNMIPKLVDVVKAYAAHERSTLEGIVSLRNGSYDSMTEADKIKTNIELSKGINKMMAVAEGYPELKSNENFIDLSNKLFKVEDEIARLQKDEAYLFGTEDDIPGGTGKNGNSGTTSSDKELNAMRDAVGVTY